MAMDIKPEEMLLDRAFSVLLLLIMTQAYRVVAVVIGIPEISYVTAFITVLCSIYIIYKLTLRKVRVEYAFLFFLAIFLFPSLTLIYTDDPDPRNFFIQLHYFLLFISSGLFFSSFHLPVRIFLAAFFISVFAMALSIVQPGLFSSMAEMASARFDYLGRGSGLFLQPNLIAYNLILMMMLVLLCMESMRGKTFAALAVLFLGALFLTGSRGGMIAGTVLLVGALAVGRWAKNLQFALSALALLWIAVLIALSWSVATPSGIDLSLYLERVSSIFADDVAEHGSVALRLAFQHEFILRIYERPFLGYGLGSIDYMLETEQLIGAAHNQFLDSLLQYGLAGGAIMLACAFALYRRLSKVGEIRSSSFALILTATLAVSMMGTNMIFSMQNFYVFLGFALMDRRSIGNLRATRIAKEGVSRLPAS